MSYKKPVIIAQNQPDGSFAGGCPAKNAGTTGQCHTCERSKQ